ncbi:MAG: glycosyltransferase family 39 protein [Candidatus Thermoplasmatota archaeon]|nr:glycosyltransferase family 39 protein [Candidatus Thermoplasmatota archaeon]
MYELEESRYDRIMDFFRRSPEIPIIAILVSLYILLGNLYAYPVTLVGAFKGAFFPTSGGSDPYYNWRAIEYTIINHHWLYYDNAINYPLGTGNPRTPYFHFLIIMVAYITSPFVHVLTGAEIGLLEIDAVFGGLLIIPVYLMGKELFGKRAGLIGAVIYTLIPSNLTSGILSDGRMHTPELIFAFFTIYFFQMALNKVNKTRIIENLTDLRSYVSSIKRFIGSNMLSVIYILLAGTSMAALMLAWQGYAYIEAIIVIYIFIQYIFNILTRKPSGYLFLFSILFMLIAFGIGSYYYVGIGDARSWLYNEIYLGIVTVAFGFLVTAVSRRPWLVSISIIAIISVLGFAAIDILKHGLITYLISGAGYFVKTRVYSTIAEAAAPPLGQYIGGFGAAEFIIGISGLAYILYYFAKNRKDSIFFMFIFSIISIYMSFAAARFNITAAPVYAILGAGLLVYLADVVRLYEIKNRRATEQMGIKKSIKGNIKPIHVFFVVLIVLALLIPSGFTMVDAAVPANNAASLNNQIYNSLPSFLRPSNYSSSSDNFVGSYGVGIINSSYPLSQAFEWLATQNTNVPLCQRPAFVSWWDYGFEEVIQGKHPSVADDFQQGYQVAGQVLLSQNESQIIGLFLAREVQGSYEKNNSRITPALFNTLATYLGSKEAKNIESYIQDPSKYSYIVLSDPSVYGNYSSVIGPQNTYFALVAGQLAEDYPLSTIVNAYQAVSSLTGSFIQYIGVTAAGSSSLFPYSGNDTGIFYAPSYLSDHSTYTYEGEVVPYEFYNIIAETSNATYPLKDLPTGASVTGYQIQYTPEFYNTTIYRAVIGYPPSAVGQTGGIPGIDYDQSNLSAMPAWNMSNFIVEYYPVLYNPYKDYKAHISDFRIISLQQGYKYATEKNGTVFMFSPMSELVTDSNPILAYYPGATVTGRVTTSTGAPVSGVLVTIYDQYGIPHEYVRTNRQGYYNLTALPGNDTVLISEGKMSPLYLAGSNVLDSFKVNVTQNEANRIPTSYNATTDLPDYYFVRNYVLKNTTLSGSVEIKRQTSLNETATTGFNLSYITKGYVQFTNSTYGYVKNVTISDGNYTISGLPPYNYSISVISNGVTYENVSSYDVGTSNATYNVDVNMDTIFALTYSSVYPLTHYRVVATSSSNTYTSYSNSTGTATIWVVPGNYTVRGDSNGSISTFTNVSFPSWGLNYTVSPTPVLSANVSGLVKGTGSTVNISFFHDGQIRKDSLTARSVNGSYDAIIPVGTYTIYAYGGGKAYLKTVVVNSDMNLTIYMNNSYDLNLTSSIKGIANYTATYEVLSPGGYLSYYGLNSSLANYHNFALPEGQYEFAVWAVSDGNDYSGTSSAYVSSSRSLNVPMTFESNLTACLFDSSKGSSYGGSTYISHGIAILYYAGYPIYFTNVSGSGLAYLHYKVTYPSMLSLELEHSGFASGLVNVNSSTVQVGLNPLTVNFTVLLGNGVKGTFLLDGATPYVITVSNGIGTASVLPGVYGISAASPYEELNLTASVLTVPVSQNFSYVSTYTTHYNVTSSSVFELFNSEGKLVDPRYISAGTYTFYSFRNGLVNISSISVNANVNVTPTFYSGFSVTLTNSLGNPGGYYLVTSGDLTVNTTGTLILPEGTYTISYFGRSETGGVDRSIHGTTSLYVSTGIAVSVPVTSRDVYSQIDGYIHGSSVANIFVYNQKGVVVNSTVSGRNGYYSLGLFGGNYTLYYINSNSSKVYLRSYIFSPFSSYSDVNATLSTSNKVYLYTSVNGIPIFLNVTIIASHIDLSYNSSNGYVMLPSAVYAFSASQNETFVNYTGSTLYVSYAAGETAYVSGTTYINLNLERHNIYDFNLTQINKTASAYPLTNVTYEFTLRNTGNTNVTVKLYTGNLTWNMTFQQKKLTLLSGQMMYDNVTVTVPLSAPAGLNTVPVRVNYSGGNFTGDVKISVLKKFGYVIKPVSSYLVGYSITNSTNLSLMHLTEVAIPNGTAFMMPLNFTNTGNAPENITLELNTTVISSYGWNVSLVHGGKAVSSLYLGFNSTETVYAVITPNGSDTSHLKGGYFDVSTVGPSGTKNYEVIMTPFYTPSLHVTPYPTGNQIISNYTGNPTTTLITGLIIIVVAVLAGLILAASRSRRNNR